MNKIVKIIMDRDGYDYEEAISILFDTKNMMDDCDDPEEAVEIFWRRIRIGTWLYTILNEFIEII